MLNKYHQNTNKMKTFPKFIFSFLFIILTVQTFAQISTEVGLLDQSDIDVTYDRPESYIDYLNQRGISKENIFKDYYTKEFKFDAGKLKSGQVKEIKIPFKNTSSDDYIKITAVNEICSCLKADFPEGDAGKFKPGETKAGTVKFDTKGLSGKIRRPIEVRTFTNRKEINYLIWIQAEISK